MPQLALAWTGASVAQSARVRCLWMVGLGKIIPQPCQDDGLGRTASIIHAKIIGRTPSIICLGSLHLIIRLFDYLIIWKQPSPLALWPFY
jgi:hypothetical protein